MIKKCVKFSYVNRWAANALLILACANAVLAIVGWIQGKHVTENALWALALTSASLSLRSAAALTELKELHADRDDAVAERSRAFHQLYLTAEREK